MSRKQLLSKQANFISVAAVAASLAFASVANAGLIEATTQVGGRSQHTLAEQWWQSIIATPIAQNPLFDTTGAHGASPNQGGVVFLAGAADGKPVTRTVTVPHSTALFFPIINFEADNTSFITATDPFPAPSTFTPQELLNFIMPAFDDPKKITLFLELNGVPVDPAVLFMHRQTTDPNAPFSYTVQSPDNTTNKAGFDATLGTGVFPHTVPGAVSDGFWVALDGLAPGSTLKLHFGGVDAFGDTQDNTYFLQATVPEPPMLLLVGIGVIALVARRRRSSQSRLRAAP